jgi:subtilisin-like proprotein convertase family protein
MSHIVRLTAVGCALALASAIGTPAALAATLPLTHQSTAVSDTPNDGVIAPGDELAILETLHNGGGATLTGLQATLTSSTPGVVVTQGTRSYPDLPAGADAAGTLPFRVQLPSAMACGTPVHLTLTVSSGADVATVPLTLASGVAGALTDYAGTPVAVGDSTPTLRPTAGLTADFLSSATASVESAGLVKQVQLRLDSVTHPDISQLSFALRGPGGTTVTLVHAGRGGPGASFTNTELVPSGSSLDTGTPPFTGTFQADGDLSAFADTDQEGAWRLTVDASDPLELGRVDGWTLRIAQADCSPRSVPRLALPGTPDAPVAPGASVDLDASTSSSVHGPITRYEWDLGSGTFADATSVVTTSFARGSYPIRVRVSDALGVIGTASGTLVVSLPPVAHIVLPAMQPKEGALATLDGSGSTDPEGAGIAAYDWDLDGDNHFGDAGGAHPSTRFAGPGNHTVRLRVTDVDGATNTTSAIVDVLPTTPPTAAVAVAPNPVRAGAPALLDASASTDDGTITGYEWDLDGDGTFETPGGGSPLAAHVYASYPALVNVGVRVTDDDGRTDVARVPLHILPATGGGGGGGVGGGRGGGGIGGSAGGDAQRQGGQTAGGGLGASLTAVAIQPLKRVSTKGLALRCQADRAATCSVTATLQPADARRLGLSKSRKKAYVLGRASARLKKAGAATLTVRLVKKAARKLSRTRSVVVIVSGTAVDGAGGKVALKRAVRLRR